MSWQNEDPASVAAAKFAEAVKTCRSMIARGKATTDEHLRNELDFAWPLSAQERGWKDRVILQARREMAPAVSPFRVGGSYLTLAGETVRFVKVHNEGTTYETMEDEQGVNRYTRRDFGRVTGSFHDYSDPRNTPPPTQEP